MPENIRDLLDRVSKMEEEMSGTLIELCSFEGSVEGVSGPRCEKIMHLLNEIKEDTVRHARLVKEIIARNDDVKYNG